jgi:hypothetical protein
VVFGCDMLQSPRQVGLIAKPLMRYETCGPPGECKLRHWWYGQMCKGGHADDHAAHSEPTEITNGT